MTATHTNDLATTSDRPGSSPLGAGVGSALVALIFTWLGAHDWVEIAVISATVLICTGLIFGIVVPRAMAKPSAGGAALALAIPAVLLVVPAFWAGIPFVLGAAGAMVGNAGRRARRGSGLCLAAVVLGALAMLGYLAIYLTDLPAGGLGFLFD